MIEEINSADNYGDEATNFEPPPPVSKASPLPWIVAGVCVVALIAFGLYSHSQMERVSERVSTLEKTNEELTTRLAKSEEDRKAAVRRATELAEKGDEVTALGSQLKEKDAALTHQQQVQDAMVARLRAVAKANKKVAKQIEAALPKTGAAAAGGGAAKPGKSKGKKHGARF